MAGTALKSLIHAVGYAAWIIKEIFSAGLTAIVAAFSKDAGLHPIVIFYPLRVRTDWQRFWFSTSVTATPGTLSIGFRHDPEDPQRVVLLVQAVFGDDPIGQIEGLISMEEHLSPSVAGEPIDPAVVQWIPYQDLGPDSAPEGLPPAERLD